MEKFQVELTETECKALEYLIQFGIESAGDSNKMLEGIREKINKA